NVCVPLSIVIDVMSASYLFSHVEGAFPCENALFESNGGRHDRTSTRKTAILAIPRMLTEI
ncbi:MAG: hypothetical protein ACREAW_08230, partial [Nitrososphaera sp.]